NGKRALKGTLNGEVFLRLPLGSAGPASRRLEGNGKLAARDGELTNVDLIKKIERVTGMIGLSKDERRQATTFKTLEADFILGGGYAEFTRLYLINPQLEVNGNGTMTLEQPSLDLALTTALAPQASARGARQSGDFLSRQTGPGRGAAQGQRPGGKSFGEFERREARRDRPAAERRERPRRLFQAAFPQPLRRSTRPRRAQARDQRLEIFSLESFAHRFLDIEQKLVDLVFLRAPLGRQFGFLPGVAHAVDDFLDADGLRVASQHEGFFVGERQDELGLGEQVEQLLDDTGGQAQPRRQLREAERLEAVIEIAPDQKQHVQRELFAPRRALRQEIALALKEAHVLVRVAHLRAQQHDHPADVQPEEKQQQDREARIDDVVARR